MCLYEQIYEARSRLPTFETAHLVVLNEITAYNITNLQWAYVTIALRQRNTDQVTNIGNAMLLH